MMEIDFLIDFALVHPFTKMHDKNALISQDQEDINLNKF